jgi:protein tyrosine phosphatase (PTP) superfamily phosphohydrolase (DUF442 family)
VRRNLFQPKTKSDSGQASETSAGTFDQNTGVSGGLMAFSNAHFFPENSKESVPESADNSSMVTFWRVVIVLVLALVAYQIHWTSTNRIVSNFYEVYPGELYRSAQPFPDELKTWSRQYGIKSVINLRGRQDESEWYINESATLKDLQVKLYDVGMGTHHVPHRSEILNLINALSEAPRPILVHCRVGADRTGEAVALYALLHKNATREEALAMLSPRYLHFPFLVQSKTLFIQNFGGVEWVRNEYDPCSQPFRDHYEAQWCEISKKVIKDDSSI